MAGWQVIEQVVGLVIGLALGALTGWLVYRCWKQPISAAQQQRRIAAAVVAGVLMAVAWHFLLVLGVVVGTLWFMGTTAQRTGQGGRGRAGGPGAGRAGNPYDLYYVGPPSDPHDEVERAYREARWREEDEQAQRAYDWDQYRAGHRSVHPGYPEEF